MAFTEDLAPFFSDFAVWATLDGQAVQGIFDDASALVTFGAATAAALAPTFVLPTSSVPAGVVGRPFQLNARNYLVAEHEQAGTGISTLRLERA